jgi:hypothetical protein
MVTSPPRLWPPIDFTTNLQTSPLVREGAPRRRWKQLSGKRNERVKSGHGPQRGARHQDIVTDWLSVLKLLWLSLRYRKWRKEKPTSNIYELCVVLGSNPKQEKEELGVQRSHKEEASFFGVWCKILFRRELTSLSNFKPLALLTKSTFVGWGTEMLCFELNVACDYFLQTFCLLVTDTIEINR